MDANGKLVNVHACVGAACTRPGCGEPEVLSTEDLERPPWLIERMATMTRDELLVRAYNPRAPYTAVLAVEEFVRRVQRGTW